MARTTGTQTTTLLYIFSWNELKARITSVKLSQDSLVTIDQKDLHRENRWVRTMNVVKDAEKFLVITTLSNWRSSGDFVDVHSSQAQQGALRPPVV